MTGERTFIRRWASRSWCPSVRTYVFKEGRSDNETHFMRSSLKTQQNTTSTRIRQWKTVKNVPYSRTKYVYVSPMKSIDKIRWYFRFSLELSLTYASVFLSDYTQIAFLMFVVSSEPSGIWRTDIRVCRRQWSTILRILIILKSASSVMCEMYQFRFFNCYISLISDYQITWLN